MMAARKKFGKDADHPIVVLGGNPIPAQNVIEEKAFATKLTGSSAPRKRDLAIVPPHVVPDKETKQWFPMGTWIMDLVKFGPLWYVFFVEGNSRFLIAIVGNAQTAEDIAYTTSVRVYGKTFVEVFKQFLERERSVPFRNSAGLMTTAEARPVKRLIGDSERAFWTPFMLDLYRQNGIKWNIINVKQEGHRQIAILDRTVRTIRDMHYRTHYDSKTNRYTGSEEVLPEEMNRLVTTYNHTWHRGLSDEIGTKISPHDVHYNERLERKMIASARVENYLRTKQPGFLLDIGQKVLVKNDDADSFEKKRSLYIDGIWTVVAQSNHVYAVQNGEQMLMKPRSLLVPLRREQRGRPAGKNHRLL